MWHGKEAVLLTQSLCFVQVVLHNFTCAEQQSGDLPYVAGQDPGSGTDGGTAAIPLLRDCCDSFLKIFIIFLPVIPCHLSLKKKKKFSWMSLESWLW